MRWQLLPTDNHERIFLEILPGGDNENPNQYLSSLTWKNSRVKYLTVFFPNSWSAETEAHCVALARGAESSAEKEWDLPPPSFSLPGLCLPCPIVSYLPLSSSQRLWLHHTLLESLCFQAACRGPQISVYCGWLILCVQFTGPQDIQSLVKWYPGCIF